METIQEIKELAWQIGQLSYLLYPCQESLYDEVWNGINSSNCIKYAVNVSRRFGKTTVLLVIAFEFCLRNKNSHIRFFTKHSKMMSQIIEEVGARIVSSAPETYRPDYKGGKFKFYNGSVIHVAGLDDKQHNTSRGRASHLVIIDEAGFINDLNFIFKSVILPTTMTTKGTVIFSSSPGETPAQDFSKIVEECEALGFYSKYTLDDNTAIDEQTKIQWTAEAGGRDSSFFRREYLCQFVVDESRTVIPEWKDNYIQEYPRHELWPYYHKYVALDLGVVDYTAGLFAYYDFPQAKLIIEDEITMNGPEMTTLKLKDVIVEKELELWGDVNTKQQPKIYRRVCDNNNLQLVNDFITLHKISLMATSKDSLEAMVNEVRLMINSGRVLINPRCKKLIGCLRYAIWNKRHNSFDRSSVYQHYDHLAALIYLVRNLDKTTNPVPQNYNYDRYTMFNSNPTPINNGTSQAGKALADIFNFSL
jgi:hypothetical protein